MRKFRFPLVALALLMATPLTAWSYAFDVTIDTTNLAGTDAILAFDFIDGDGVINNTVDVSKFFINGFFDPNFGTLEGDVTSTNDTSATFHDGSAFNEVLVPVTLGSTILFRLETTNLFSAASLVPDAFSFFILNATTSLPLFATTDPTGSDALFVLSLDGSQNGLSLYTTASPSLSWTVQPAAVPLPGAFSMMLLAGVYGGCLKRKRRMA